MRGNLAERVNVIMQMFILQELDGLRKYFTCPCRKSEIMLVCDMSEIELKGLNEFD